MTFHCGDYIWAKMNKKYWPGIILQASLINKPAKDNAEWVYWFGDGRISEVRCASIVRFHDFITLHSKDRNFLHSLGKRRYSAMLEALKYYKKAVTTTENPRIGDTEKELLGWCLVGFPGSNHNIKNDIPSELLYNLQLKNHLNNDSMFFQATKKNHALENLRDGSLCIENLCIGCYQGEVHTAHPLFKGGLCFECRERYMKRFFMIGIDNIHYCCAVCSTFGNLIVCSVQRCGLSYCHECLDNLGSTSLRTYILGSKRWDCFICSAASYTKSSNYLKCGPDWRVNLHALFDTHKGYPLPHIPLQKERIRVLSLFDGISTGLLALKQLNIDVEIYYAAELDFNAKSIALNHHSGEILYMGSGDVREINATNLAEILPIHLVIGGSPCNDLSMANPVRQGLFEMSGTGVLFFEYCRIINTLKRIGNVRFFWLYENVASMQEEAKNIISSYLECQPSIVNSACVSPQKRLRYFWGNCPSLHVNLDFDGGHVLQDYLEPGRVAAVDQIRTITTNVNSLSQGASKEPAAYDNSMEPSTLTINEIERIFGLPEGYTQYEELSKSGRLTLIGRAWSVQTIVLLMQFLKTFFKLRKE